MKKQDQITNVIKQDEMLDNRTLEYVLEKHRETGRNIVSILKEESILNEDQLLKVIAAANSLEFINLSPEMIDPKTAHLVPYKTVSRHNLIPIKTEGNKLIVAMSAPLDLFIRDKIELETGYTVKPVAALPDSIKQAIHYYFSTKNVTQKKTDKGSQEYQTAENDSLLEETLGKKQQKEDKKEDISVKELASSIIRNAIDARASDIHIEPQDAELKVRYRIDGMLRESSKAPKSMQSELVSHIKVLADMDISEKRIPQDGHINMPHGGKEYNLRISSLPSVTGEKIVIRILDKNSNWWNLDSVVDSEQENKQFRQMVKTPYGIMLLTGPTGSGKTTTLYSVLQLLNTPEKNIVTVEDPVEYRLDGVTQVQVRPSAGMTFAKALRSILRQDPDIILIGEIRDLETAEIAVSSAMTGHLVLSTLHTNTAAGAIARMVNIGIPPFLLASSLLGSVAQRLVRKICKHCKQPYKPSKKDLELIPQQYRNRENLTLYKGTGCPNCFNSGYQGRTAIYEILPVDNYIKSLILDNQSEEEIRQKSIENGTRTLVQSAMGKVFEGKTTIQEVARVVDLRGENGSV